MHRRFLPILLTTALLLGGLARAAMCQEQPAPPQDPLPSQTVQSAALEEARKLEKEGRRQDAINKYREIANEYAQRDPELAAEALFQGGLYAFQRYGTNASERSQGLNLAVDFWKQLRTRHPLTRAAGKLEARQQDGESLWHHLTEAVQKRNSSDWRWKLMHALVTLSGSRPSFSYALALILLAVIVKIILWPLTKKQYASMNEMKRMQPLVKQLQEKYKGKAGPELNQKIMELYKEHGVNPLAGCMPMLLMIPFFILVFTMIQLYELAFEKGQFLWIGSPLANAGLKFMGHNAIGRSLAHPDIPLLLLYAISNYVTMRLTPAADPAQQQQQNTMALMMSGFFFFIFISSSWPSAFVLYWLALNLISIWQQYEYVYKPHVASKADGAAPAGSPSPNGAGASVEPSTPLATPTAARVKPRKKKRS